MLTVSVWRSTGTEDTPRGPRPKPFEHAFDEDSWGLAPPDPADNAEPDEASRSEVIDWLNGYREGLETGILSGDEVEVPGYPGGRFQVMGTPGPWTDYWTSEFFGSTMRLKRVNG